ncbi:MAG: cytochrome b/b6 domain-containing protein [Rubrivivax sp.]|nr:cytochrome b/b6 domain-containing protein [Rubrivivax sp.]
MKKLYVNPLPVRIWHWANALGFVLLILTGLQIRYVGQVDLVSFHAAVVLHNWTGFVLIANFFIWLGFYLFTDKIKVYHPELSPTKYFKASFRQMQFYGYGIFRGEPNPHHVSVYRKFNPLQSMMYQIVMMILVPVQFFSGVLLWDLARFAPIVDRLGGVRVVDTVHVLIFIFFCGFIFVHVYLSSLGHTPSAHFKAMITGYEDVEDAPEPTGTVSAPPA